MNIEFLNSAACLVMMVYMLAVAAIMPPRGAWVKRLGVWLFTVMLGLQVIAPLVDFLPAVGWYTAILHCALTTLLVAWRKEALALIRVKFASSAPGEVRHMRRGSDWGQLAQ